jgi:hypothetical protein
MGINSLTQSFFGCFFAAKAAKKHPIYKFPRLMAGVRGWWSKKPRVYENPAPGPAGGFHVLRKGRSIKLKICRLAFSAVLNSQSSTSGVLVFRVAIPG